MTIRYLDGHGYLFEKVFQRLQRGLRATGGSPEAQKPQPKNSSLIDL